MLVGPASSGKTYLLEEYIGGNGLYQKLFVLHESAHEILVKLNSLCSPQGSLIHLDGQFSISSVDGLLLFIESLDNKPDRVFIETSNLHHASPSLVAKTGIFNLRESATLWETMIL